MVMSEEGLPDVPARLDRQARVVDRDMDTRMEGFVDVLDSIRRQEENAFIVLCGINCQLYVLDVRCEVDQ
jgi:hypothetical protein